MAAPPPALPPTKRHHLEATALPLQLQDLSDDILHEIFLRIDSTADLTCASAACTAFCRLITDPAFVLRHRERHRPLLLALITYNYSLPEPFHRVEVPPPNSLAARALDNLSLDYLPMDKRRACYWLLRDTCDGRLLFECYDERPGTYYAVCNPLSRQSLMLPPVPHCSPGQQDFHFCIAAFAPCADEDDEASFRVVAHMDDNTTFLVSVFDSGSGSWSPGTSSTWEDLLSLRQKLTGDVFLAGPSYAYGCAYWKFKGESKLIKLDMKRMELSTVDLPPALKDGSDHLVVVEAEKGRLGVFCCTPDEKYVDFYCCNYSRKQSEDQRAYEWQMGRRIPLPVNDGLWIFGAAQGYVLLQVEVPASEHLTYYFLDTCALKLQRVIQMGPEYYDCISYFTPRPSLTSTRI